MQYRIVALATLFALFWDEALIGIFTMWFGRHISPLFMICWIVASGIIAGVLVALQMPIEYRMLTTILISIGVLFSIHGYGKLQHDREQFLETQNTIIPV